MIKKLWNWIKHIWPYEIIEIREDIDIKSISVNQNRGISMDYLYKPRYVLKRKRR